MTAAEYVAWERDQPYKHEFHDGEVFAMSGGSARHNYLGTKVAGELQPLLRARNCHVMSSDQRIAVVPNGRFVYADAVAACGPLVMDQSDPDALLNPCVIVEVLSPSTEKYDRGEKWELYQRLPSVTDYLLVSQFAVRVEHYRRQADGVWLYRQLGPGESVALTNGAEIAIDALYEGAFDLPAARVEEAGR